MALDPNVVNQIVPPISIAIVTIIIGHFANYAIKKLFKRAEKALEELAEKHNDDHHKAMLAADRTKFVFTRRMAIGVIYTVGILFMIGSVPSLRTFSYSLLAGAGVMAVIIGFATQKTFANIISGMMISISQPFRIGDRVKLKEEYGTIEDITLRHTVLNTWDNRRVIIPNAIMNDEVIVNYTLKDEKILSTIEIGISFDSDIDLARKIMREEIVNHPDFIVNTQEGDALDKSDAVKVRVIGMGDSSINLRGYYWAATQPKAFKSACELRERIKKRFDNEGVEIPFPYRTLVYKKDLKKSKGAKKGNKAK
ncbi:mechanosensitive ion channel family protein [Candidatus Woesearchaeota archaeon]|nr:mechanosensitive ion channel family protein [Candidatus Woesearchaeota archaeon]